MAPFVVLVAEDNLVNQKVASFMLAKLGCRVDVVATGREAVQRVLSNDYDMVFMDCQMPEMDGYEATHAIRNGASWRIPIIAFTANAMSGDREKCLQAGMDDYISKPVRAEDFRRVIEQWGRRTRDLAETGFSKAG